MSDDTEDVETVEVPLSVVRDSADLFGYQARIQYEHNNTVWGDRYHSLSRLLNDAAGDEWGEVGIERYESE